MTRKVLSVVSHMQRKSIKLYWLHLGCMMTSEPLLVILRTVSVAFDAPVGADGALPEVVPPPAGGVPVSVELVVAENSSARETAVPLELPPSAT